MLFQSIYIALIQVGSIRLALHFWRRNPISLSHLVPEIIRAIFCRKCIFGNITTFFALFCHLSHIRLILFFFLQLRICLYHLFTVLLNIHIKQCKNCPSTRSIFMGEVQYLIINYKTAIVDCCTVNSVVNNYIVRSYRDVIVVTNIATRRTSKA